jgi:hypothetical protein
MEFDSMSHALGKIFMHGVCPDYDYCWFHKCRFEFEGCPANFGIWYCPRCLRSWAIPSWGGGQVLETGFYEDKEPSPSVVWIPSISKHEPRTHWDPIQQSQDDQLSYYAGIMPELFTQIFIHFPEAFPAHLHPELPGWLFKMVQACEHATLHPVFYHRMYRSVTLHPFSEHFIYEEEYREAVISGEVAPVEIELGWNSQRYVGLGDAWIPGPTRPWMVLNGVVNYDRDDFP